VPAWLGASFVDMLQLVTGLMYDKIMVQKAKLEMLEKAEALRREEVDKAAFQPVTDSYFLI
jgi:hypothetical protein